MQRLKRLFSPRREQIDLCASLRQYLDDGIVKLGKDGSESFLEHLEILLQSEDPAIAKTALLWVLDCLSKGKQPLPSGFSPMLFERIRVYANPWLQQPLLDWVQQGAGTLQANVLDWLGELDYESAEARRAVIEPLLALYLQSRETPKPMLSTLKTLDAIAGEVTDVALQRFPLKSVEENCRIIELLGKTGRFRAIKPLIRFSQEFPQYLRAVMKALSRHEYDEVNQFYIDCLKQDHQQAPIVLIEAIKQIRKRRLRKAIPHLDTLFPMEDSQTSLINRTINGEIALTMASFGTYTWAREKLLSEMMLGGIHLKYLKAIDMLHLEEAVPLLKAIMLMPESPELQVIQQQAYLICERLLSGPKPLPPKTTPLPVRALRPEVEDLYPGNDFLAF